MKIHIIKDEEKVDNNKIYGKMLKQNNISKLYLLTNNSSTNIEEEETKYILNENTNHSNDKIMRKILKDRKQVAFCLNEWLKVKEGYEIKENDLEEVTESYITTNWEDRESDIVYKDKKYDGVFYLIEHQTKVDYKMAKRIAEYKNEIRSHYQTNTKFRNNKEFRVAKVIAIVLYTGKEKWKASKNLIDLEVYYPRINESNIDIYQLVSSQNYTINELKNQLKENNQKILSKIFLIDRIGGLKNANKIESELELLKVNNNDINYIASYINKILNKKYGEEISNQMIKILEKKLNKEEDKDMLMEDFVVTLFEDREKKGEKRGKSEGISHVAINMLKAKCDKELIKKCTGLSYEKIKKLEKSMETA